MTKPIMLFTTPEAAPELGALAKSHVSAYTRKDGAFVAEHEDKRQAKGGDQYGHPNVVGHASNHKVVGAGGKVTAGNGDPTHHATTSFDFAGKTYRPTGKTGNSMHDKTPVHEFEHEESGHRVWADNKGRVHADSTDEVKKLRAAHEAHSAKSAKAPAKKAAGSGGGFASHADARRKIADGAGNKVGARIVQHDDSLGLSSVSHKTASAEDAQSSADSMGKHLESHGFQHKETETSKNGSHTVTHHHYEHPSGAKATVSHSSRMSTAKGKSVPGASLEVHSGVEDDEKTPWRSK